MNAQEQGGAPAIGGVVVDAVAEVLAEHRWGIFRDGAGIAHSGCMCRDLSASRDYEGHVAAAVVEALVEAVDIDRAAACIWGEITDEFWSQATPKQQARYRGIARAALGVSVVRGVEQP